MSLICSICAYLHDDSVPQPAITVMNGSAVCVVHAEYAQGGGTSDWRMHLYAARTAAKAAQKTTEGDPS